MACDVLNPVGCLADTASDVVQATAGTAIEAWFREAATESIKASLGWWISTPAATPDQFNLGAVSDVMTWLGAGILTIGIMWSLIRLLMAQRADPLVDIGRGVMSWIIVSALGVTAVVVLMRGFDALAMHVLDQAAEGQVAQRLLDLASMKEIHGPVLIALFGVAAALAGVLQALLAFFREGAIAILTMVLILAAAGQVTSFGRSWLPKVAGWLGALILYKFIAALIYAMALGAAGSTSVRATTVGIAWIVLAIIALPALFKFFSWTYSSASNHAGGSNGFSRAGAASQAAARSAYYMQRGKQASGANAIGQAAKQASGRASAPGSEGGGGGGNTAWWEDAGAAKSNPFTSPLKTATQRQGPGTAAASGLRTASSAAARSTPVFLAAGVMLSAAGRTASGVANASNPRE